MHWEEEGVPSARPEPWGMWRSGPKSEGDILCTEAGAGEALATTHGLVCSELLPPGSQRTS